jgi:hypothetical protein
VTLKDLTAQDIANWADSEGGVYSLYEHGIDAERIVDSQLAAAWRRLKQADELIQAVKDMLPEPSY